MGRANNLKADVYQESEDGSFTHNGKKYSLNKVFKIIHNKSIESVEISELAWILKYCYDIVDGQKICHSCRKGPKGWHEERIKNANLNIPIIITRSEEGLVVLDGLHRLERAIQDKVLELPAKYITETELKNCKKNHL